MPKIPRIAKPDPEPEPKVEVLTDKDLAAMVEAEHERFAAGFRRSKKGNIWRTWEGVTVTIFERAEGFFRWSIADGDGVRYSPGAYETDGEALEMLAEELGVGLI